MKKLEIKEKVVSAKFWVVLIVYIVLLSLWGELQSLFGAMFPFTLRAGFMNEWSFPYLVGFLILALSSFGILKLNVTQIAMLFIASMVVFTRTGASVLVGSLFQVRTATAEIHGYVMPSFWLPSAEAWQATAYAGSLPALYRYSSEWTAYTLTHIWWYLAAALMVAGWGLILRRLWVDVEALPFPHAQGWLLGELTVSDPKDATVGLRKKIVYTFTLLGFLFNVPIMLYYAYPGFPDVYGWITGTYYFIWTWGVLNLGGAYPSVATSIVSPIFITLDPLKYAYFLLVPLDTLMSMSVAGLVLGVIAPQILSYFGYYPGLLTVEANPWTKWSSVFNGPPLQLDSMMHGMVLGIFILIFLPNWKYFVSSIRSAISRKTEPGEVSYTMGYGLMLAGSLALVVLFFVSGVEFIDSILGVIVVGLQFLVCARMRAYTANAQFVRGIPYMKWLWGETMPAAPLFPQGKLFLASHVSRWGTGIDIWGGYLGPMFAVSDSYKVASWAKVNWKTITWVILLSLIIASVIGIVGTVIGMHLWGNMQLPMGHDWDYIWDGDSSFYNTTPPVGSWPNFAIGTVWTFVLALLRMRFAWWPIEPIGFAVMLGLHSVWHITFFLAPVVWVIKYTILRVGGRKAYDNYVVPAVIGWIAGNFGLNVITMVPIRMYRYFAGI